MPIPKIAKLKSDISDSNDKKDVLIMPK